MKRFLVALLALAFAASASASTVSQTKVSATNVNTKVTFTGTPPVEVIAFNDGADAAYVDFSGTAVAADGTSLLLNPCQGLKATFSHDGPSSVGVITATGKTATVRVTGFSAKDYGGQTAPMSRDSIEFFGSSAGCSASMNGGAIAADSVTVTGAVSGATVAGTTSVSSPSHVFSGTNGAGATCGWGSESLTLATGATTTDTSANLLPANSLIVAVVGRVTTTITAACTGWELGDATTAARFTSNDTTLTAGEVAVGMKALAGGITTDAAGPTQTSAAKVRVTCAGGNPGAGVIRVEVFACTVAGPTS